MKLRGAISGFGEVAARAHLPGWQSRPDVRIVAVHDPIAERRHLALRLIKNVRVYDDLHLMLAGERPDFLDIASPPALHADAARAALEAGAHLVVEKPLCLTARDFDALRSIAAARSRVLMCVHNWKHAPVYRLAHELVASGRVGVPRFVSLIRLRTEPAGRGGAGSKWRMDAALGGGILIDHGWHVFYLIRWLMGAPPNAVSARLQLGPGSGTEEAADLRIAFPGDRAGYCELSWRASTRRTSATLYADEATLEIDEGRVRLISHAGKVEEFQPPDVPDDSYHPAWFAGVAADFQRAVSEGFSGATATQNLDEAKTALAAIIGARESNTVGRPVEIARLLA